MAQQDFGLIGLAVMGQNLVLNIEEKGFSVAVFNRTAARTKEFMAGEAAGKKIVPTYSIEGFMAALKRPRRIMLMVKAGAPVDEFIGFLLPHMEKGDLILDGGNSFFLDTIRRNRMLAEKGFLYIGTGVSGGEEGARHGPSIMPGGQKEAYDLVAPILTKMAARVNGDSCCTYIGADGAGHYVKMVHNGIEYGDMQLISEAYYIMKYALGMNADELHQVFDEWDKGPLNSYLIEITRDIFARKDEETGQALVELILDKAGQKGTGKWASQNSLDLGISVSTITEAVFARCISAIKEERVAASKVLSGPDPAYRGDRKEFIEAIRQALYASKICSYAQGFALMKEAGKEYKWELNFGEIAMIWRGGCIIRAQFLHRITEAYQRNRNLANLMLDPFFKDILENGQAQWRHVIATATHLGLPIPAFTSALAYFDSYRHERLPANLIQAQRDYFGAHTYERVDKPGTFHTEWTSGAGGVRASSQ
ncbi:MAG: NADP-dependent phosphogluconate dehydrogenase [Armatimonadota bacterium]|jgi:6-phosphogluconate dehydrogenase